MAAGDSDACERHTASPRATRQSPYVGMEVTIVHLRARTPAIIEAIGDSGRTLVADGETFELSPLTAQFVRLGDPYYGVRLALRRLTGS
jgi:hypothetical protein